MAQSREDVNFEDIKREAYIEALSNHVGNQDIKIAHLRDEQFEMLNEIKEHKETISKLEDYVRKDKRWNMLWQNSLDKDIDHTKILVFVVGFINVLFTYFMSK